MSTANGIVILTWRDGTPAYVCAPDGYKQKLKDLLDINHLKENPNPLNGECEGPWFYVPWKALTENRRALALQLFNKVKV